MLSRREAFHQESLPIDDMVGTLAIAGQTLSHLDCSCCRGLARRSDPFHGIRRLQNNSRLEVENVCQQHHFDCCRVSGEFLQIKLKVKSVSFAFLVLAFLCSV
jgi:hypothetical protein